jgi:hypothetical protein
MRSLLLAAALALSTNALSQAVQMQTLPPQTPQLLQVSPALEVQRLAPQLIAFAGSDANFQNLVNGLALGTQVTLSTVLPTGGTQIVSFTPTGTMTALQIAQTLEGVRQSLIQRGIATPSAQQLAIALVGGALPTALGTTPVNGVIATSTPLGTNTVVQQSPAVSMQGGFGAAAAAGGTAGIRGNTSDSPFPRGISDTPPSAVPGATTAPSNAPAAAAGATPGTTPTAPTGGASVRTK